MQARSPVDGAPQGWQDSNLRHAFGELLFWPLNYIPMKLKTARWGLPCERLLVRAF